MKTFISFPDFEDIFQVRSASEANSSVPNRRWGANNWPGGRFFLKVFKLRLIVIQLDIFIKYNKFLLYQYVLLLL